jgi:mono/diheme cytochrome c family protein
MDILTQRKRLLPKLLLVLILLAIGATIAYVALLKRPWAVPEKYKTMNNPVAVSETVLNAACKNYKDKCVECHGDAGKGDGPEAMMYEPAPADLTDAKIMRTKTDGEIYYQITEGRKPMPSFRKRLTEEERWQLVVLVRSFAAIPTGEAPVTTPPKK